VGLAVLAVYRTTLLPGVGLWDTAEAQAVPWLGGTMHPTGFPAWVVLGWIGSHVLAPLGDVALRMNLLSAGYLALAAALLVPILRRLDVPLVLAAAAGIGFGLTGLPWRISAAADVHALHVALVALLVLALLRWEGRVRAQAAPPSRDRALIVAAGTGGLALGGHALTLLLAPAVLAYVAAVDRDVYRRPRFLLALLGVTVGVAALLYLQLPLSAGILGAPLVYGTPGTFTGFWSIVLARQFQGDFVESLAGPGGAPGALAQLAGSQFGILALVLLPALAVTAWRRPAYALLSGVATLLTCTFAALYVNADITRYYLGPVLFGWTWLGVLAGAAVDLAGGRLRVARPVPPSLPSTPGRALPVAVASVVAIAALLAPTAFALGERRGLVDRSQDTEMAHWLDDAMTGLAPDAVVVSWWSWSTPLWYGTLVEELRPDLRIVDDSTRETEDLGSVEDVIDANLGRRPVYLIRLPGDIGVLERRYAIEPVARPGGVYRVTARLETAP
jgi:hypothetical protein